MSYDSNKVKSEFLNMNHGTAQHRLRKLILFKYITLAGDDICFKCNMKIIKVEDLSIEHKQSWLNVSTDLFWDLDNIAFSHLRCNKPDRLHNKYKTICPKGHSDYKAYGKHNYRHCKVCNRDRTREYKRRQRAQMVRERSHKS